MLWVGFSFLFLVVIGWLSFKIKKLYHSGRDFLHVMNYMHYLLFEQVISGVCAHVCVCVLLSKLEEK